MSLPQLSLSVTERGDCVFSGINLWCALILQEVPAILEERHAPAPRERLFPDPTRSDPDWNDQWRQLVAPELESLFQSAGEIIARDLARLQPEDKRQSSFRVEIPAAHVNAWISALNQARLILGAQHKITEADMNDDAPVNLCDKRTAAVMKIRLLGIFVELLVQTQLDAM
jgi:hypothetical protein